MTAMQYLFISSKVESRIASLEKAGKVGKALAQKATDIIESLASGTFQHRMDVIASYTKYGEKRIKHCRKYDLGCGHRLITLMRGSTVFIPFMGTHDACRRWLESNSRLKDFKAGRGRTIRVANRRSAQNVLKGVEEIDIVAYDHDGGLNLTDKDLRRVFAALVKGAK